MTQTLISICYEGDSGSNNIRTCQIDGITFFSLKDIFVTLNKENKQLGEENPTRYIPNLIKSQLQDLDDDEYHVLPSINPKDEGDREIFVTHPGLNRVMGTDKSKAGRKFQRWLYHDVVPSLAKYGMYPPPLTPQGSALAQMAEILAQNSRALADAIIRQDILEQEVNSVKGEVLNVSQRVAELENSSHKINSIVTVRQWFDRNNLALSKEKEFEIVTWCENLSLRHNKPREACPSGERLNARYYIEIIKEAKYLVEKSKGVI